MYKLCQDNKRKRRDLGYVTCIKDENKSTLVKEEETR